MTIAKLLRFALGAVVAVSLPGAPLSWSPAYAGPPFLTDDPEPTELGHWEIYAPLADTSGRGGALDGGFGAELNYGAARNLQLTLGLPLSYTHGASGWRLGRGDLEASAKYRFYHSGRPGCRSRRSPALPFAGSSHLASTSDHRIGTNSASLPLAALPFPSRPSDGL